MSPVKGSVSKVFVVGDDLSERSMRKAWVNCPKCSFNLLSLYTEQKTNQPAEPSWDDIKKDYSNLKNEINTNKTETGCGCLMMIFIVLIIYWLLS